MAYHCHVQTHVHLSMGLVGMFIIEENRPNNWLQTLNVGAGQVRHPSVAILEEFDAEYDLHYHALDKELQEMAQKFNDPRLTARQMNRLYDLTDATEDYHTLNGRSYPYTLRESLVVVEPNQKIKLHLFNSQGEIIAIHTHGHKATMTHYDGIEHNPAAQITRDVYELAPAQRLDLTLDTTDDGLHSYGSGVWIFHDHREKGITTDGMNPGGNVSAVVYKNYLTEEGLPKVQGVDLAQYFTKEYYQRRLPAWQQLDDWNSLGTVSMDNSVGVIPQPASTITPEQLAAATDSGNPFRNFIVGLLLGALIYWLMVNRKRVEEIAYKFAAVVKESRRGGQ